ncbi:MAG: hypothetical protein BGO43_05760 [Gammaproteobacteria bacterium 39-13]|nr:hypothetical protein [Gammaproteobacteria bacterium]OJV91544.1 MAG: hypothetical protein BGO43_05760 [Gammaproteobacteria bacterium 39-13]
MDMNWHMAMFITGCLITSSFVCKAEENTSYKNETTAYSTAPTIAKHNAQKVVPSETLLQVFENLDKVAKHDIERDHVGLWNEYKGKLKALLAVQFTDSFQIGIDQVKSGPLNVEESEIVDVNLHLSPKSGSDDFKAKGYGLEVRLKLD